MQDKPLLTKGEAAELLSVSQDTLEGMMRDGEIKPVALRGRIVRFRRTDLDAYIDALKPVAWGKAT